jgi:hypothetical protein
VPTTQPVLANDACDAWPSPASALTGVVVGSSVGIGGGTRPICSARPQEMRSRAEPATAIVRLAFPPAMAVILPSQGSYVLAGLSLRKVPLPPMRSLGRDGALSKL